MIQSLVPKKTESSASGERITVETGIIVPVAWDKQGRPAALALSTYRESEYLINTDDVTGKALFKFLQRKVKIVGLPGRRIQNRQTITVLGFVVMKDSRSKKEVM